MRIIYVFINKKACILDVNYVSTVGRNWWPRACAHTAPVYEAGACAQRTRMRSPYMCGWSAAWRRRVVSTCATR